MTLVKNNYKTLGLVSSLIVLLVAFSSMLNINKVYAGTILGDNQSDTLRFFYQLINGPPTSGVYPGSFDGPEDGLLGMIRQITGPTALGSGLSSNGITSCSDVPSTGTASLDEGGDTFLMHFQTPIKTIPTGYTGAGSTFDKRVTVQYNGTTFMNIEFQCSTEVGWLRFFDNQSYATPTTARHVEVYWDTQTSTSTNMDLYMYYEQGLGAANGNEYFMAKFATSGTTFKIWLTRAVDFTGTVNDTSMRSTLFGSTADDIINAYMLQFSGGAGSTLTDTSTGFTDNSDINLLGDLQCIDFNNGGIAADATGSCSALALTVPTAPIIDNTGDSSINWLSVSMKTNMTAVVDP